MKDRPVRADFLFFIDMQLAVLKALGRNETVTSFESTQGGVSLEFEVYVKRFNGGRALPRVTAAKARQLGLDKKAGG